MGIFDRFKKNNFDEKGNRLCPKCQSENVLDIMYGYPSNEAIKKRDRGEIVLGGCCIDRNNPRWACDRCNYRWK
jgi:hypothetical protein